MLPLFFSFFSFPENYSACEARFQAHRRATGKEAPAQNVTRGLPPEKERAPAHPSHRRRRQACAVVRKHICPPRGVQSPENEVIESPYYGIAEKMILHTW